MFALIDRIQELVNRIARAVEWLPPAVARLCVGVVFALSGWGKLHSLEQVTSFFTDLGLPAPAFQAAFVSTVELVGGALLIAGLLTRYAAVPLMITMVVAILTAQRANLTGLGSLVGLLEFAYIALLLWLAVAGGGRLSLDHLLSRLRARRAQPA
jgi:putative oxidoreductase